MKKKIVIGLVGRLGSGKDECANYLAKKTKGEILVFSNFIKDALNVFDIPLTRENITWTIKNARKMLGDDTLAKVITEKIKNSKKKVFVLPGVRKMSEVKFLKKYYKKDFILVSVDCDDKIRWKRVEVKNKGKKVKKDPKQSLAEFLKRDHALPNEKEISKIQKVANNNISNNGSKKDLQREIDQFIKTKKI